MLGSPAAAVLSWTRGILSALVIVGGFSSIGAWYNGLSVTSSKSDAVDDRRPAKSEDAEEHQSSVYRNHRSLSSLERIAAWRPGIDWSTLLLLSGVLILFCSMTGRHLHPGRYFAKKSPPTPTFSPGVVQRLSRPDGSEIYIETRGPSNAPTVILVHGWSLNRTQWVYLLDDWGDQFRVVVWDLAGLGKSKPPDNDDFSLEKMTRDLQAVIEASGPGPVILLGHSIGGMIILTFCRLFPEMLGTRVSKLILAHTTYINPLYTMARSGLFKALQKPLIEPLIHLQICLSPLVWCMTYMSYWNGSIHSAASRTGFGGSETWSQLDFVASFYLGDSPAILARGALAMLAFDETRTIPTIEIPVLVIGGEQDPLTVIGASQRINAELPAGQLFTFPHAKHFALIEYHAEFAKLTAQFCLSESGLPQ